MRQKAARRGIAADSGRHSIAADCSAGGQRGGSPLLFVLYFVAYLAVLVRMLLNGGDTGVMRSRGKGS